MYPCGRSWLRSAKRKIGDADIHIHCTRKKFPCIWNKLNHCSYLFRSAIPYSAGRASWLTALAQWTTPRLLPPHFHLWRIQTLKCRYVFAHQPCLSASFGYWQVSFICRVTHFVEEWQKNSYHQKNCFSHHSGSSRSTGQDYVVVQGDPYERGWAMPISLPCSLSVPRQEDCSGHHCSMDAWKSDWKGLPWGWWPHEPSWGSGERPAAWRAPGTWKAKWGILLLPSDLRNFYSWGWYYIA